MRDINLVMEPMHVKTAPESGTVGKFSLPYSMASLLCDGSLGLNSYDSPKLVRANVLELARKITYEQHDFSTAGKALPGAVEITLKSGQVFASERLNERGGPAQPLTATEILEKFKLNCGLADVVQDEAARPLHALSQEWFA